MGRSEVGLGLAGAGLGRVESGTAIHTHTYIHTHTHTHTQWVGTEQGVWSEADEAGLGWALLGWAGLGWAGLGWAGLVEWSMTGHGWGRVGHEVPGRIQALIRLKRLRRVRRVQTSFEGGRKEEGVRRAQFLSKANDCLQLSLLFCCRRNGD